MSWLNFNDSLNNIKGQLSTFANNVLADDKIEIHSAVEEVTDSETRREGKAHNNAFRTDDSWQWSTDESKTDQLKTDETITNLKKRIVELEYENRDLIASLDQLDQDHQLNTEELVKLKSKLEEELEIVTEKYEILNMKYNKLSLAENAYKKKVNELKSKYDELSQKNDSLISKNDTDDASSKYEPLQHERTQLEDKVASLVETNRNLEELIKDTNAGVELKLSEMVLKYQQVETENKALRIALQSKKEETTIGSDIVKEYETKIKNLENELRRYVNADSNNVQDSSEAVGPISENNEVQLSYQKRIGDLENELEDKRKNEIEMQKRYAEIEELKLKSEKSKEANENASKIYEERIETLKGQLKEEQSKNQEQFVKLEEDSLKYRSQYEELLEKSKEVHMKYSQIIDDHFREYFDYNKADSFIDKNDNLLLTIFSNRLKTISEIIANLEVKCNSLETKLFELNQNKTDLQNEKNAEIERLMQNSEMLTQEILKRSQEIKDLEEECSQLMKNNDLLINKLTESKETGLQTIFESNEDNVVLFEKQLETANKKIEELEKSLSDHDSSKHHLGSAAASETILEEEPNAKDQLELSYEELEESLNKQREANESLKKRIEDLEQKLYVVENERDNSRVVIDKMTLDFETTEYQFTEMNINLETLSEEIEKHKLRIDSLVLENESLKSLNNDNERSDEELKLIKEKLSRSIDSNKDLESKIANLEEKFTTDMQNRNFEIEKYQKASVMHSEEIISLQEQIENASRSSRRIQTDFEKNERVNNTFVSLYSKLCEILKIEFHYKIEDVPETNVIVQHVINLLERVEKLEKENVRVSSEVVEYQNKVLSLENNKDIQKEVQDLMLSRNELIAIVQTKHQETLTYHAEIQRLSEILKTETDRNIILENQIETLKKNSCSPEMLNAKIEEIEKLTDQISFLREKCDILAQNMLDEQRKVENEKLISVEKETTLSKKLERLQSHLMEVEEHYTQELLQSEQKIALLQARLNEAEQREKDSSTVYTSVSIRANQQNEALHQQLQSMTSQRDEFRKKLLELEDENNVKSAALSNLQLVLEQFQRDKEGDVVRETDRIRRQVKQEQKLQEDLRKEISNLESQLRESKQGLQAALRLTDQLEMSKSQISNLKETVTVLTEKLNKKEEELKMVASQTDGKVDKSLVKNLIIGFVTCNKNLNKDQMQILKIIATVLDFNEQDHTRVNLNQMQQSNWLRLLLNPAAGDDIPPSESLSRAFVNFLEKESKPRVIPSLLTTTSPTEISTSSRSSSKSTTPTPIVLNEIVLPTFSDFPQHRNSSSILKGVLKDNS